jgi:hypothetical protein
MEIKYTQVHWVKKAFPTNSENRARQSKLLNDLFLSELKVAYECLNCLPERIIPRLKVIEMGLKRTGHRENPVFNWLGPMTDTAGET